MFVNNLSCLRRASSSKANARQFVIHIVSRCAKLIVMADFLLLLALCALPMHSYIMEQQKHFKQHLPVEHELVNVHEHVVPPVVYAGGIQKVQLDPDSIVVGVQLQAASKSPNNVLAGKSANGTKQSQEFELDPAQADSPSTTTKTTAASLATTKQPPMIIVISGSGSISTQKPFGEQQQDPSSTQASVSTTTSEPKPVSVPQQTTEKPIEPAPVGTETSRRGSEIKCGEANPNGHSDKRINLDRIVGGHKTEPGEFPFQVRLNIRSRRGSGICGGVIFDDWHILTAAHCMTSCVSQHLSTATIENTGVQATIGDHAIRSNDGELELAIEKIVPHPKYDACNFYSNNHDIAIIKTATPIEYRFSKDGYGSVNRPCMPENKSVSYIDGENMVVSGWGVTRENSGALSNILRFVQVPLVNVTRCQETYGSRVTNNHVCAGLQSGGKDSCQGDSGGPLVRVVENRYELVGIVSFGYGCGQPGAPGVYTRVASYLDWIQENL